MNIYTNIKQEIQIEGDLHVPVISQKNYNEIVVEASRELKIIANELFTLFEKFGSDNCKHNQAWLANMMVALDNCKYFRENIETCNSYRFYWRDGLQELFISDSPEIYNQFEALLKVWETISSNGLQAVRSILKD